MKSNHCLALTLITFFIINRAQNSPEAQPSIKELDPIKLLFAKSNQAIKNAHQRTRNLSQLLSDAENPQLQNNTAASPCMQEAAFALALLHNTQSSDSEGEQQCTSPTLNSLPAQAERPSQSSSTRTPKSKHTCTICGQTCAYKSALTIHMRTHSGEKPYQCDTCGKRFSLNGNLTIHMRTHSGEKPYQCDTCGKRFSLNGNLTIHMHTHSGEKPFKCNTCGKSFALNGTLTRHIRIHSGEKPFKCDTCGKSFARNSSLKKHQKSQWHLRNLASQQNPPQAL